MISAGEKTERWLNYRHTKAKLPHVISKLRRQGALLRTCGGEGKVRRKKKLKKINPVNQKNRSSKKKGSPTVEVERHESWNPFFKKRHCNKVGTVVSVWERLHCSLRQGPTRLSATVPARLVIASENDGMVVISWAFEVLLLAMGLLYLRILCASILRFWLLEHTTATRSGWLGIATPDDTLRQTALETN